MGSRSERIFTLVYFQDKSVKINILTYAVYGAGLFIKH